MRRVWKNIGSIWGWRKNSTFRREDRRVDAYRKLFSGQGTQEHADIVLVDLAKHTGFFMVTGDDRDNNSVRMQEGMRAAFLRIYMTLNMDPNEVQQLATLARVELMQDEQLEREAEEQNNVS